MTIQPSEDYDNNFVPDVSTQLFDIGTFGLDLIAINIQHGRDQGLPVYLLYRHACGTAGGGQITEFDQLGTNISPAVSNFSQGSCLEINQIFLLMHTYISQMLTRDMLC